MPGVSERLAPELPRVGGAEARAQLVLEVAKAAGAHLEVADVLSTLLAAVRPEVAFDAVCVCVIEGDHVRLHSLHVDGIGHHPGEPVERVMARAASVLNIPGDPKPVPHRLEEHYLGRHGNSREPRIITDLAAQREFPYENTLLEFGLQSYVGLPLLRHGRLIGAVHFNAFEKQSFSPSTVRLLQDLSEIVSIAVSNALAFEEIRALKDQLQAENRVLQDEIVQRSIYEEIVGSSRSLQQVLMAIDKVGPTDSTVLITGETGTGKELVAHAIHRRSQRAARALVKVNCAALPQDLIASEMFGHEKGAFTGALQRRIGRFEAANGGTIFLDEIGELPAEMQIALLRVLQEREFERVGDNRTIRTDARVIVATNKDLEQEVEDGQFRMDLYYRLNVFPVRVPPLRERVDDIPVLVDYFVSRFARRMGKRIQSVEKRTLDALAAYDWPGNIRELQNVIERGVILTEGGVFRLEPNVFSRITRTAKGPALTPATLLDDRRAEIERMLRETRGRISGPNGAAIRLGVPASTLESRIRALGIDKHSFRTRAGTRS